VQGQVRVEDPRLDRPRGRHPQEDIDERRRVDDDHRLARGDRHRRGVAAATAHGWVRWAGANGAAARDRVEIPLLIFEDGRPVREIAPASQVDAALARGRSGRGGRTRRAGRTPYRADSQKRRSAAVAVARSAGAASAR
jgi:hypothetical protein